MSEIDTAKLRELAERHLGEGPPYVKNLHEACSGLRQAADAIDRAWTIAHASLAKSDVPAIQAEGKRREADAKKLDLLISFVSWARANLDGLDAECDYEGWSENCDHCVLDRLLSDYDALAAEPKEK